MKGKIALGTLATAAVALAATVYTEQTYQRYTQQSLELIKAQYPESISEVSYDRIGSGLFSQEDRLHIEMLVPELAADETISFSVNQRVRFYPGIISAEFDFDVNGEIVDKLLSKISPVQDPIGTWSASVFSGNGDYQYASERFEVTGSDGESMVVNPFRTTGTFTLDLKHQTALTEFEGFELNEDLSLIRLKGLSAFAEMELIDDIYDVKNSDFKLDSFVVDMEGVHVAVDNLAFQSKSNHENGFSSWHSDVKVDAIDIDDGTEQLTLTNNRFDSSIANVPTNAYFQLLRLSRDADMDPALLMTTFDDLVAQGLTFSIANLSGNIKGSVNGMPLEGEYSSNGQVDLAATDIATLQTPLALEQIKANMQVNISDSFFVNLPPQFTQQLDQLKQQGFIAADGDKLTSKMAFDQGLLTLNGKPLPL